MKKQFKVTYKIEPRSGKGKSKTETKSFFAETQTRATALANYFKYVMYDRKSNKVTTMSVKKS